MQIDCTVPQYHCIMEYKKIVFETKQEADAFKQFLAMKGVRYALIEASNEVIIRDFITEQQMYMLVYKFGKWY